MLQEQEHFRRVLTPLSPPWQGGDSAVCPRKYSALGRTRTSGVSLWLIYSQLSSPLDYQRMSWSGGTRTLNAPVNSRVLYHWATDQSMWRVSNPPVLLGRQVCRQQHFTCIRIKEVPVFSYPFSFLPHRCGVDRSGNDPPCKDFQSLANPSQLPVHDFFNNKKAASRNFFSPRSYALCNISVLSAWFKIEIDRGKVYSNRSVPMFFLILSMRK